MLAQRRVRYRWSLTAALAALAVVLVIVAPGCGERSKEQSSAELPFEFREAASPSTDALTDALQRKLRENPEDFDAHIDLANAYLQKVRENGDPSLYTKAENVVEEAERLNDDSPELFATQGTIDLARHDFAAALKSGKQALALDPENARYYGIVGDAQIELGMYDEAIESYQEMVDRRPDFASFARVGHARELYGDPEGAIEAMEFAIESGSGVPENMAWAYVQLGNLWFGLGDLEEAAKAYDQSIRRRAAYAPALAGQARIAAARGDLDQAAKLYQQAFNRMPQPEYAIALGDVYSEMGDEQRAEENYELVRAMDALYKANGVNTDLEMALFFADHGLEPQRSLEKARSAYESRPSIHAAEALAWTLYKTGNHREAQRYASEALKLGTRDPLMLFQAGMIAKSLGQDERAKEYLQRAVDLNRHFSLLYSDTAAAALDELEGRQPANSGGDD
jgi:tetratricopeptide (TPR) repeat protein